MFGGGAGSIADMIARMKEVPNAKKNIKKYREYAKTLKNGKKRYREKEITKEELEQIRIELRSYKTHNRNTFLLFLIIFVPLSVFIIWGIVKLLAINTL